VLDYLMADDTRVIDCFSALNLPPETAQEVRQNLPGGALPNWT